MPPNRPRRVLGNSGRPGLRAGGYAAASVTDRALATWNPAPASADADLLPDLDTLRPRSRDLIRNHGIAGGAQQTLVDNVLGTGLRLCASPDYKRLGRDRAWADEWSREVEALWRAFANSPDCDAARTLNFDGLATMAFKSVLGDGESLVLPLWLPNRGTNYATAFQVIEADRLGNPQEAPDTETMRGGVEVDAYGAPVAYHVRKAHPGDVFMGALTPSVYQWERIPARTPWGRRRVLHLFDKERPGQSRGRPFFSAVMPLFKMHDHYQKVGLQSAIVNAMIAAFVETPLDSESLLQLFGGNPEDLKNRVNEARVPLRGGAIIPLQPGEKVSPFNPNNGGNAYQPWVENVLQHIAAGLNLPRELFLKDFSRSNYSSARAALLEAWRFFLGRRAWWAFYLHQPAYELWLEEAVNRGEVAAPGFYKYRDAYCRSHWLGPGRGWIDPVKEANAAKLRVESGLSTLQAECAEQGLDWQEVMEQRDSERQFAQELERRNPGPRDDGQPPKEKRPR